MTSTMIILGGFIAVGLIFIAHAIFRISESLNGGIEVKVVVANSYSVGTAAMSSGGHPFEIVVSQKAGQELSK